MIRSILARLTGVTALRASTERRLSDLARATSKKADAARRDAEHSAAAQIESLRNEVRRLSETVAGLSEREKAHHDKHDQDVGRLSERSDRQSAERLDAVAALGERVALLEEWAKGTDATAPLLRAITRAYDEVGCVAMKTRQRIAAAALEFEPSPHVVIDDVLPDDFYELLLATIPPPACFEWMDHVKSDFRPEGGPPAPTASRLLWQLFDRDIVDGAMRDALLTLFAPVIHAHYATLLGEAQADAAASAPMSASGRLMRRLPGYHLEPHLDPKRVLITGILYCARPEDSDAYGTSLYRVTEPFVAPYVKTFYPREHGLTCELAKTVAFRPNRLFAFINSTGAHAADIPADATQADRYAFQFYIKPDTGTLKRLIAAAPPETRAQWSELVGKVDRY